MMEYKSEVVTERYTFLRTLWSSCYFGDMLQAIDRQTGQAVKVVHMPTRIVSFIGLEQIRLQVFRYQDDTLPMVKVRDVHPVDGGVYVVYEDLPGAVPILEHLTDQTFSSTLEVLANVCDAVAGLHERKLWHGGIVPENVFVLPTGEVRLMTMLSDSVIPLYNACGAEEVLQFFAPETMKRSPFDSRTDIYNLGVLFYRVLTGTFPFTLKRTTLHPPSRFNPHIPPQLDRMVMRMINAKPSKRYQWIGQITAEFSRLIGRTEVSWGGHLQTYGAQHLFAAEFTGREAERKRLSEFLGTVVQTGGKSLLITGEAGVGRKRLIDEVCGEEYGRGLSVITGDASDKELSAIEEYIGKMFRFSVGHEQLEPIVQQYLPRLFKLFPGLAYEHRDLLTNQPASGTEVDGSEQAVYQFVVEVLRTTGHATMFVMYEAHLVDDKTLKFMARLLRQDGIKVGLIAIAEQCTPRLDKMFSEQILIEPLNMKQLRKCVLSRLGHADFLSDEFMEWLNHHCQGNLDRVFQLIEFLADTRQIFLAKEMWSMQPPMVEDLQIPHSFHSMVLHRVERLSEQAQEICQTLSLFKGAFSLEAVAHLHGIEFQELLKILHSLVEHRVLLQTHQRYQFASNGMKQQVYLSIEPMRRRELHQRLARCLLAVGSQDEGEVAAHYESGEEWREAILMNLLGARRCKRQGFLSESATQMKKAIELYPHLSTRICPRSFTLFLADTLAQMGRRMEAAHLYLQLYEQTNSLNPFCSALTIYASLQKFNLITPYLDFIKARLADEQGVTLKQRAYLMITYGIYHVECEKSYKYVLEMEEFHKQHGTLLREKLAASDYLRWIFYLQAVLRHVPGMAWEKRSRYLHEAATLAEHHGIKMQLPMIYSIIASGMVETDLLQAKEFYLKAVQIADENGDMMTPISLYSRLAGVYRLLGDLYHACMYLEKANELIAASGFQEDVFLVQREAELLVYAENFAGADAVIDKLVRVAKRSNQHKMRQYAFLYRFDNWVNQGLVKRADRMWEYVERIYKNDYLGEEFEFLRAKYDLLKGRAAEVIDYYLPQVDTPECVTEVRVKRLLVLFEAFLQEERVEEGLKVAQELQKLINQTRYFGYLPWVHYHLGRAYQMQEQFVTSNLHYKRAMIWFRKLNQQERVQQIHRLMHGYDEEMFTRTDRVLGSDVEAALIEVASCESVVPAKKSDGARVKKWVRNVINDRTEVIDALAEHELLFDAIRRVGSSILIKDVCENIADVIFGQLLIDGIHLHVVMSEGRVEQIHLDEQLMRLPTYKEVDRLTSDVMKTGQAMECMSGGAYFYALPIHSYDQAVMGVIVIEKRTIQNSFTGEEKHFINNLLQLVSANLQNAVMYEAMITDDLTGLYTRDYFLKRLQEEFAKVEEYGADLSFVMIDLDDFSQINNQYGHNEGDRALRLVSQTLRQSVRNIDIVGRFGGEELIVILPNTNGSSAKIIAERILNNLRNLPIEEQRYRITASIGVGSYDMDAPIDMLDLIEKADQAETFAKQSGKNRVVCHWEMTVSS